MTQYNPQTPNDLSDKQTDLKTEMPIVKMKGKQSLKKEKKRLNIINHI